MLCPECYKFIESPIIGAYLWTDGEDSDVVSVCTHCYAVLKQFKKLKVEVMNFDDTGGRDNECDFCGDKFIQSIANHVHLSDLTDDD